MPTREESLASMRDALQLADPDWDITPGTLEYRIIEALAQQIENLTFNSVLNDYHFDVDKKSGLELDLFMTLFGFARVKARRATGEITFQRGTAALQDYIIPMGTQVFMPGTQFAPSIYFQTTISAVLPTGALDVSIPVQAVVAGSIGNVSAGAITGVATSIGGVTGVFNASSISGGRDAESDADLRERWRRSVFRNISGTEDQFLALAFNETAFVSRANVIGPIERYREQIQLTAPVDLTVASPWTTTVSGDINSSATSFSVANGDALSAAPFYAAFYASGAYREIIYVGAKTANSLSAVQRAGSYDPPNNVEIRQVFPSAVPDAKYLYPAGGEVVGTDINLASQQAGRPAVDYDLVTGIVSASNATAKFPFVRIYPAGATSFGLDSVVEVDLEYTPLASRNSPPTTVDKVDMYTDGQDPQTVIEQVPMSASTFGGAITIANYLRDNQVDLPQSGNFFVQLSKTPILSLPDSISVSATGTSAATTYFKDQDYYLVKDQTIVQGSPRSADGMEWRAVTAAPGTAIISTQLAVTGKLNGWYAYVYTFETDGVETLPSTSVITVDSSPAPSKNVAGTKGKNTITVPTNGGAGTVKWRKIYRSAGRKSQAAALAGPFFLDRVIKDNSTTTFTDNKPDTMLHPIEPPKSPPPTNAPVTVEYSYNQLVERLDAQVQLVRLIGMDTLVHAAEDIQLKFNLAVVLVPGMNAIDAKADIQSQLAAWINRKDFRNNVQLADIIDTVSDAPGVDNVRLATTSESRNAAQKITVVPVAVPDPVRDSFTITVGGQTTGEIAYNESSATVRELLEILPNINEGNSYVTQMNGTYGSSVTSITMDDNPALHVGNNGGASLKTGYYIQVGEELLYVSSGVDNGGTVTLTVKRAQLGSLAISLPDLTDVHAIGDVAVSRVGSGTDVDPYIYTINFLPNLFDNQNDWGLRGVDLISAIPSSDNSHLTITVAHKVVGVGAGIEQIAQNDKTIITRYTTDFYLQSDQLPSLFGVDVLVKAQNTF